MAIRDLLTNKTEDFMRSLAALVNYKKSFQWEKALDFVQKNTDAALWAKMKEGAIINDKSQREAIAFLLTLKYHEVDILQSTGESYQAKEAQLSSVIDAFLKANEDVYFMELEEMKKRIS